MHYVIVGFDLYLDFRGLGLEIGDTIRLFLDIGKLCIVCIQIEFCIASCGAERLGQDCRDRLERIWGFSHSLRNRPEDRRHVILQLRVEVVDMCKFAVELCYLSR